MYVDLIAPLLLRMVRCSVDNGKFPDSPYEANKCLILKKDRDDSDGH